jgi:hypothetical protein
MAYKSADKMVSHPSHYQSANGLELINVIEAFTSDLKGIEASDTANVIKYICRWKNKNGMQDLEKAMWYLQHLIDHVRTSQENFTDHWQWWGETALHEYTNDLTEGE